MPNFFHLIYSISEQEPVSATKSLRRRSSLADVDAHSSSFYSVMNRPHSGSYFELLQRQSIHINQRQSVRAGYTVSSQGEYGEEDDVLNELTATESPRVLGTSGRESFSLKNPNPSTYESTATDDEGARRLIRQEEQVRLSQLLFRQPLTKQVTYLTQLIVISVDLNQSVIIVRLKMKMRSCLFKAMMTLSLRISLKVMPSDLASSTMTNMRDWRRPSMLGSRRP